MAPNTKVNSLVLRAGASDSEDDLAGVEDSNANVSTLKLNNAKAMPARRRASTAATKRKAAPETQKRPALKDRTNIRAGSDTEEVDNFEEDGGNPKAKRAKTTAARKQTATKNTAAKAKSGKTLSIIPETQPDPEDVSQSIEVDQDGMDIDRMPTPPQVPRFFQRARSTSVQPLQPRASARSASAQPLQPRPSARSVSAQPGYPPLRERSGSVSDTARERRGGDPELKRKLNEMTKQYDTLKLKYQNIEEIGHNQAVERFENLKRQTDQQAKDQNAVIASLKKELAEARKASTSSSETTALQSQVTTLTTSNNALTNDHAKLKSSLQESQNEVKSLQAKLVAARQQLSQLPSTQEAGNKAPGSATTRADLTRSVGPNATDAQKEAKMKENLYSDLTGLIIRGVKRKEGEDEYDCIQTGRNGSTFTP